MTFNRELSECIFVLYGKSEERQEFGNILTQIHVDNNKIFNQMIGEIQELNKKTENWDSYFQDVKVN